MRMARVYLGSVLAAVGSGILRGVALVMPLLAMSAVVAPAGAQIKDVPAYTAVVTGDNAWIRCGAGMYYKVADLPKGKVVQVDGEDGQWARIAYPAGTPAYVRAEEAKVDEAAGTVRLTAPSPLRAVHSAGGFGTSWKSLLDAPLAEGTSLKLIEVVKENGTLVGYKVVAPSGARGFVELKSLKKGNAPEAVSPKPETKPAPKPVEPATKPAADTSLLDPIKTGTPVTGAQPTTTATPAAEQPRPAPRRIGTPDELEAAFQSVRKQPPAEAEYSALIAEFQRAVDQAGASPDGASRKRQLERRRDFLKIQAEAWEKQMALERTKKELDDSAGRVNQKLAELERQRVYTIIGLLVPSTVYDGKNLPLMYRLQAVGVSAPPTIGYLAPKRELQLETKLGMVVGVVGESTIDRALSLNVINPIRVDVLQAVDGKDPASGGTPPPAPSAEVPTNKVN